MELDAVLIDLYRSSRELPTDQFIPHAFGLMSTIIPFDSAGWGTGAVDQNGPRMRNVVLHNLPPELPDAYLGVRTADALTPTALQRPGRTSVFAATDSYWHEPGRDAFRRHCESFHQMNMMVTVHESPMSDSWNFVVLARSEAANVFDGLQGTLMERVMPHLMESWRANREWNVMQSAGKNSQCRATSMRESGQRLEITDPGFESMMRLEWPTWTPSQMPRELCAALDAAGRFDGKHLIIESDLVAGVEFVVARRRKSLQALTLREIEVARKISSGLSYKEAARHLGISPLTVRAHLHNVYQKLGISNRMSLALRMAGSMDGSDA